MTLYGDASNVLALRNGTTGQAVYIYGSYTDATDYDRLQEGFFSSIDEVVQSVLKLDIEGIAKYNVDMLRRNMNYGHRMLKKIAENPDTLVVKYNPIKSSV